MSDPVSVATPGSASASVPLPSTPAPAAPAAAPATPGAAPATPGAAPATPGAAPATPGAAPAAPAFAIPEAFKDRPYLKGVDSMDKVWSMLDGAQKIIGERPAGIPKPEASPEEWAKFYDAAGRPKTAAEYQFELDPSVKLDEKFVNTTKEIMYKNGLTQAQAKGVQKDFDAALVALAKERGVELQKQDTDFSELATKTFGADRDKVLARGKQLISEFVNPAFKDSLKTLSNENLIILASVLNGIHAKYIKTDGPPGVPPSATGKTPAEYRAEARALMLDQSKLSPTDIRYMEIQKRIDAIYAMPDIAK